MRWAGRTLRMDYLVHGDSQKRRDSMAEVSRDQRRRQQGTYDEGVPGWACETAPGAVETAVLVLVEDKALAIGKTDAENIGVDATKVFWEVVLQRTTLGAFSVCKLGKQKRGGGEARAHRVGGELPLATDRESGGMDEDDSGKYSY